jgi:hypothetical protein
LWNTGWWSEFPESPRRLQASIAKAAEGSVVRYLEMFCRTNGEQVIVDVIFKPIRSREGVIRLLIAEEGEITARSRAGSEDEEFLRD